MVNSWRRSAYFVVALLGVAAGCTSHQSRVTAGTADTATTSTEATTTTAATLPVLAAGSSASQLNAAIARMIGPTTDIARQLSPVIVLPAGIPTPAGARISDMSVSGYDVDSPGEPYYVADVTIESTASVDDLRIFFETKMRSAGYKQTGFSTKTEDESSTTKLTYALPAATISTAKAEISIVESKLTGVHTYLTIQDGLPADLIPRLSGWHGSLPGLDGLQIDEAHIGSIIGSATSMGVGGTLSEADVGSAALLRSTIIDGLPNELYALNADDPGSAEYGTVKMTRGGFDSSRLTLSDTTDVGSGRRLVTVDIDGLIDFEATDISE